MKVALDSQCLSFMLTGLYSDDGPVGPLADQQVALARLFFYGTFFTLSDTVREEFMRIRNNDIRERHLSWSLIHFDSIYSDNRAEEIYRRTEELRQWHPPEKDCRIIAECELAGVSQFLTYDFAVLKRLPHHARLELLTPLQYWQKLEIPIGTPPVKTPTNDNPLSGKLWWIH